MILCDESLRALHSEHSVITDPVPDDIHFQPASIDLLLGKTFVVFGNSGAQNLSLDHGERFILEPRGFCLASTYSTIYIPNGYAGRIDGKSSIGRRGLWIHNAGFVDPGFKGKLTLELFNAQKFPIYLTPCQDLICQLEIHKTDKKSKYPYGHEKLNSHYQGQTKARL